MVAEEIADLLLKTFRNNKKVLICGNGGSASMSSHFAAELVGKYRHVKQALPAIALTTDTSALTAIGNDFGFKYIFSRQVEALGNKGDVLIALSTSGKSENVLQAMSVAGQRGMRVVDFPREHDSTAAIQEAQLKLMHNVCERIEDDYLLSNSK